MASVVETADGKVGIVGKLAGSTEVTIVIAGQSYKFQVTVNPLITGIYRAGAYEVAVTNASEVKYVDGDLVITYLDTTAAEKSFTLPQATTGRLLAVGGGGAGGQEPGKRDDTYGLPGGGGAGGLIIADNQAFGAATYTVAVGAGGVAPRTKPTSATAGASGAATTVKVDGVPMLTAKGGGGGGARSAGKAGGSGGGGSYSGGTKDGGTASQSDGFANAGGQGAYELFGGGGGGAGGAGVKTGSYTAFYNKNKETFTDPTSEDVYLSGAGGQGKPCDITGEMLEYARGGAGGVPRLYAYYYYLKGQIYYTNTNPSDSTRKTFDNGKYFWCEASDGKPGRDGYGDGGGGGSYYSTSYGPTFAGSGGNGVVIVRIPPYKMSVEDALKVAFAGQPATVSGSVVTLKGDVAGPICIPDNLGAVTVDLNGHAISGADGADGDDITPGGDGQPALKIVPHEYDCESGVTTLSVTGTGSLTGGSGGTGYPGGAGAAAVSADGFAVNVASGIAVTAGTAGESLVQHPHQWVYTVEDGKIVATCVADGDCSYKTRKPFVAVSASDASYTALRYSKAELVNGITPVTGVVVAPETYAGRDGTDYPESATPPREQGAYTVSMKLGDLRITSDFTITEPKPSQGSVYQAWKTAERKGRDVQIALSATFDGSKAINDGNILFLGSRCSAHSMANGTVESSVNALTRYANVRWYAYGSDDPNKNLVNQLTKKGEEVPDGTVTIVGRNHFVHKEIMDDLYAELVEKKNIPGDYDLILLEFDGDLLGRDSASPYELVYSLPAGWDDEKAARLRAAMSRYYAEDRVVWIVPDVNRPKEDAGYTGKYPWTSNPEFIWQRAFLNATETEGYKCPLQKNYEDADSLVNYLQEVLVGHFFSDAIIKDKLAEGLTIKQVTPQMRTDGGIWRNFEGGPSHYTIPEPRSETTVKADVTTEGRQVEVTFDMREEQAWACENNQVIGDDFRVVIDAELGDFFSVGEGEWQETNEGPATFTFTESNLDDDEEGFTITIEKDSPKVQNVKLMPDYASEDVVKVYDGKGTNIVVKPIAPEPDEAVIRYSLDEHGTYTDNLALTNVCEKTKVWFEITDKNGEFNAATNFACVTILPGPEPELESIGIVPVPVEAYFNKDPQNISFTVTNAAGDVITPDPEKTKVYYKGPDDTDWVPAEEFAGVSNVTKAAGSSDSNGVVTVEVKVSIEGYEDAVSSSTVRVMPRVIAEQTGTAEKPYDGTPLTCTDHGPDWEAATNYAYEIYHEVKHPEIYDGPPRDDWADAIGFPPGDGLVDVPMTGSQTEAGSSPNTVDLENVKFTDGVNRGDYALSFPTGTLTVVAAKIKTTDPSGSAENPGDMPEPIDGPTLWAENVVKVYDGVGTNVLPLVYNAVDGNAFAYEYSTNETDWVAELAFTNVTEGAQKVYFRAIPQGDAPNYLPTNGFAFVTITNRPVTITFAAADKVYDTTTAATCTSTNFENLVAGEGFALDTSAMAFAFDSPAVGSGKTVTATGYDDSSLVPLGETLASNYAFTFVETTTAAITQASMGIAAFPVEKFFDAEPTNITYVVTGAAIADATISLREKGTDTWILAADFVPYVDATNVIVQIRAEKSGFAAVEAEATLLVKPRPVTLVAGSDSKTYDGTPLTCDDFEVKDDDTTAAIPGYGFVNDEGVASVTMTPESTITDPGSVPNVIASETAKDGTKLDRNYVVTTEPGTLTVTAAAMGIAAFDAEKFYDAEPTNVTWVVTNATGAAITDATIKLREKGTDDWIPAADFVQYVDTTNVAVQVRAEKAGFTSVEAEATVAIKPRPVTLVAGSDSKTYDGTPLTCDTFTVKVDETTEGYGFVGDEGVASVTMTDESTITEPGSVGNVIAGKTAKAGTKLGRNYVVTTEPGTLTVTAATMGIAAFPVEKFYDAEATNISYVVTNAAGAVITDATIKLREKGTTEWIPAADFAQYVDVTNVTVQVRAEKAGFTAVEAEATVAIKPRPVTLVAGSDSKVYDGLPLTCDTFTVKVDETTEGYGFVGEEGVASVTMTDESTITDPGSKPNVIAGKTAKDGTKLERNYVVTTDPGTLTVTAAAMGIAAFPVEKFYDAEATNISYVVTNATGAVITDATIKLREKGTTEWIPAADFVQYVDTTNVAVQVRAEKAGFAPVEAEATVAIKPRPVTLVAGSASKTYNGTPLTCDTFTVKVDETTEGYGFVGDEGVASVTMTDGSTITDPGTQPNVIAGKTAKDGTKLERNYVVSTEPGALTVTPAAMGITAFLVEKFYDAEATNVTWVVTNAAGVAITDATISLREKGTDGWIPVADFVPYVDTTNVAVQVRAEKAGFTSVEAEATVAIKPRPVTLVAGSASKTYDGTPLTCDTFTVKVEETTEGYGFVNEEGVASVTMTDGSTITDPGTQPNVIAGKTAKGGAKLDRNYVVTTEPGTLTVTAATMGITAFPVEKFYDAEATNVTWVVTNATGAAITDATISLREKGTDEWIPAADFARYVDTTNVAVQVRAEKSGFTSVEAEATVAIKPRPVTLVAGSDSKTYDGTPLTCDTFTVKVDETTEGYGFVGDEGVASVTMTDESTITDPGSKPNVIAGKTAKAGTKLGRNYVVTTEPGTLTVTAAAMGIAAFPVEKFYDAEPTNITWVVTNAAGAVITDATIKLREKGTDDWIPAADFVQYVDVTNVAVQVRAEKAGFAPVEAEATLLVKPRPVTLVAASDSKVYDGTPLTCDTFTVKVDETTEGYGFVGDEGVASVTMTDGSTITDPGTQPNVIAGKTAKAGTKLGRNYVVTTEPGTLTVTAATMGIQAFPVEKFYDAEPTNITWVVTNAAGAVITDATIKLREKGTDDWIPVADFALYVDATNVAVQVRAEKAGFTSVEAEATVAIRPRPVTLVAGSASKTYDGMPLTCSDFTVKEGTAPEYGFVGDEGVASVTMTDESTITDPGTQPNVIASEVAKDGTKLERNYVISTEPGTLTVTAAAMGITAFPVEKFYDAEATNISYVVTNAAGAVITDATIKLREKGTTEWIPAADFVPYVDATNVAVQVRAEKAGFASVEAEATVAIKPRPVTLVAGSDSKVYDGMPLTCDTFTVKVDETTEGYGFVGDEGVASVTMTDGSTITDPGTQPNVIAGKTAKAGTKLGRNYVVTTEPGTLTVTAAAMGIAAFDAEKFYDAEPTNVTWVVTNAAGAVITDATIKLREKGTDDWIPAADFVQYVDVTNVAVQVRAEKAGFAPVEAEATVAIKPRPVTLVAGSASKTYDGTPLTCDTFTLKEGTAPEYGFVKDEGVASVTMTDESTITEPGSVGNVIAGKTAKDGTKLGRNYVVTTEPGTLTVTAAAMGIAAFPVEKFYDAEATNISYVVTNAAGAVITDATIKLREKGTDDWIPAADFAHYVDTTNVTVQVRAEKDGYSPVTAEAKLLVKPRPVTLVAGSASKVYDGTPLTCDDFAVKVDETTEGYGFVNAEGVASVTMTDESTITDPGSVPNVIASETAKDGTKLERNYMVTTEPGTLTVTAAEFTASALPYDEFYDGQEHTIEVDVRKPEDAGEATVTYSYEEGGTYLPIEDFEQLKDVTKNGPVTVYAKVEIEGHATVFVSSTVRIKPRIVVEQAESASKIYDGTPLVQPNHHEDANVEAEKSKAKWGTDEPLANSTGFVAGEGFAAVPMTAGSTITEPGVTDNVIDVAAVTLATNTKADNYIFYYLMGELAVIQRQEEVHRDPAIVIPEESKKVIEESDKKMEETLGELAKADQEATGESYVKYQLTVTPTNNLSEVTRTSPEEAAEDAKRQIELFRETVPDAKVDKVEFVDIVLERTYDKTVAEETAQGNYDKTDWEPIDRAEEHGNKLLEVTVPINVPEGMELIGVTRSCDSKGTEILKPKDPNDPDAEGFVYDPETKTVTLYAKEFCVFGFIMEEESPALRPNGDEDLCECSETKARTYEGTIISEELGVIGSITATLSRPNQRGIATLKAKVSSRFQTGNLNFSTKVEVGDCVCSEMEGAMVIDCCCCCRRIHHELVLRFEGDTMTGWFDGDGRIDGGIDVFKTKGDPRGVAMADCVGSWTGVFDVNEPDGTSGFGTFGMNIKKSGAVSIQCKMPDGTAIKATSKYQVGEDGIGIVPVILRKGLCGNKKARGFGFRLVFRPGEAVPRAYDVSPEQVYSIYQETLTDIGTIGAFEIGRAVKASPAVVRMTVQGASGLADVPDEIKVKVNKSTNALSGKCTWVSLNAKGKAVKTVGTVKSGRVVNGVGYGMLKIGGIGLIPFTCVCE